MKLYPMISLMSLTVFNTKERIMKVCLPVLNVHCQGMLFVCILHPEVTLWSSQDAKILELKINLFMSLCYFLLSLIQILGNGGGG